MYVNGDYGPGISNEVAVMVCSAPSLRDVRMTGSFHPSFYETLAKGGMKAAVHTLEIEIYTPLSSASSHHLVEALCSLPNLTNLTLSGMYYQEELYSQLKEKASTLKVHTLKIENYQPLSSASSHHLAEALCFLPNLTNLTLSGIYYQEELYSQLNEKASTLKDSFPQMRKGNFIFNGKPQKDLQSFLQAVSDEIG
nr:uncharacterized protein LOC129283380 [Lytechinus pictus]